MIRADALRARGRPGDYAVTPSLAQVHARSATMTAEGPA